ncbi:MAG TPA: TRAP transporter small permease [Gammaproteobacteria bacterium]|nr:TRAP transporter small permease [Gammaproteobacteria bacterium]
MRRLQQVRRLLVTLESWLAGGSLLLLLLLALAQIAARNLFDTGLPAADTLTRQLVLYVTFFGAVLAVERRRHIKIDVCSALLPQRVLARLFRPMHAVAGLICLLLADAAIRFWHDEWAWAADYERWHTLIGLVVPVGFVLLTLHFALAALLGPDPELEDDCC